MKTAIATAILLATATVSTLTFAHDNSCDVDLQAGVAINQDSIAFTQNNKLAYKIENQQLYVGDQFIPLNSEQQQLVNHYADEIRALVPEVKAIAMEGLDMASEGVNLAFNELLGEGNQVGEDLVAEIQNIRVEINQKLSLEQGITFSEDGVLDEDFLGPEFEERIESAVENAVQNSMGTLLMAVGQEMLMSGGDMDAFETRMENFGQQIEHEMESRGEALEQRAEELCQAIVEIDRQEELLKNEISELSNINVITVSNHGKNQI